MLEMKQFEVFRITFFRNDSGQIEKQYKGAIRPKEYEDIEKGLSSVIEFVLQNKILPCEECGCDYDDNALFTIIFKKSALGEFKVATLAALVTEDDLENILSGLMFMQIKLHLEKMMKKDIKMTLKQDDSVSSLNFSTDEQLT